jgi:hypothetical protein
MQRSSAALRAIAVQSKLFLPVHDIVFMANPLSSVDADRLVAAKMRVPADRSNPLIAPINVEHQHGKKVALRGLGLELRWIA